MCRLHQSAQGGRWCQQEGMADGRGSSRPADARWIGLQRAWCCIVLKHVLAVVLCACR
jgi:hypothetical protein